MSIWNVITRFRDRRLGRRHPFPAFGARRSGDTRRLKKPPMPGQAALTGIAGDAIVIWNPEPLRMEVER